MSTYQPVCELCGEPMPPGEEMFKFHGYSGPCPKPPKPKPAPLSPAETILVFLKQMRASGNWDAPTLDRAIERAAEAEAREAALRAALEELRDWASRIAHDERVCGWLHAQDYSLYCLLADCPVDFDAALDAARRMFPEGGK